MANDYNDELSNPEDSGDKDEEMAEFLKRFAEIMGPEFKENYEQNVRAMSAFKNAVTEVADKHDEWVALARDTDMASEMFHILVYIDAVYQLSKRGVVFSENYFAACIAEIIKWAFLRGLSHAEFKDAPSAFSDFINEDLNID